jgi:dethiobiotin synthetase
MSGIFISSSGTELGKTFVTCALIYQLKARGYSVDALKPIVSGFDPLDPTNSDSAELLSALDEPLSQESLDQISPWRFREPLSPDMAAEREQRTIPFQQMVDFCLQPDNSDITLIEGIGGVMVPLDATHTVLDWIQALSLPVLLVVGSYLGTLSHTLTAVGVLRAKKQTLAGIIVNESANAPMSLTETATTIERFVRPAPVTVLPIQREVAEAPDLLPLIADYL